jgi:acyl carrier protein
MPADPGARPLSRRRSRLGTREFTDRPIHLVSVHAMAVITRSRIRDLMGEVLAARGTTLPADEAVELRSIGFRSLDFSELALRVEDETGTELNFDAPGLRSVATVGDVLDFLRDLQAA